MTLNPIAANQTEVEHDNGVTIFFSYKTPVAVFVPGQGALCTTTKYSRTTSKHVSQTVERWGATRHNVDQAIVDKYATNLQG